ESPGLKTGGVLNVVRYNVEVSCTPDLIPTSLVLNLSGAEIGDSLHISAVSLPEGVTPTITDRDFTIATIAAPTVVKEETAAIDDGTDTEASDGDSTSESAGEETEEGNDS
ncbi:MAG: 50S ribosomal protein L25, partial [Pseudomonadota bacterium]|nr:50S ribosomal protein L25 [Pseudomonadota bacterium]